MKTDRKETKVFNKPVDIKFKTKSGKVIAFKAIETSLKSDKDRLSPTRQSANKKKTSRRKKS
ncbi:MAG: hypothetical protein WA347_08025 [Rhabdochlamydiaceae bacterium]|jgi:hypothetical protein